jgi:hypothetical protein
MYRKGMLSAQCSPSRGCAAGYITCLCTWSYTGHTGPRGSSPAQTTSRSPAGLRWMLSTARSTASKATSWWWKTSGERAVSSLGEPTGNIWMAELEGERFRPPGFFIGLVRAGKSGACKHDIGTACRRTTPSRRPPAVGAQNGARRSYRIEDSALLGEPSLQQNPRIVKPFLRLL